MIARILVASVTATSEPVRRNKRRAVKTAVGVFIVNRYSSNSLVIKRANMPPFDFVTISVAYTEITMSHLIFH